jgi:hypothetical protein
MSWSFTSGVLKSILHEQRIYLDKVKELDKYIIGTSRPVLLLI